MDHFEKGYKISAKCGLCEGAEALLRMDGGYVQPHSSGLHISLVTYSYRRILTDENN